MNVTRVTCLLCVLLVFSATSIDGRDYRLSISFRGVPEPYQKLVVHAVYRVIPILEWPFERTLSFDDEKVRSRVFASYPGYKKWIRRFVRGSEHLTVEWNDEKLKALSGDDPFPVIAAASSDFRSIYVGAITFSPRATHEIPIRLVKDGTLARATFVYSPLRDLYNTMLHELVHVAWPKMGDLIAGEEFARVAANHHFPKTSHWESAPNEHFVIVGSP